MNPHTHPLLHPRALRCAVLALSTFASSAASQAQPSYDISYTIGAPGNRTEVALKGDTGKGAVQPGGSYNFSIPIEVPPGPRGIAPRLALVHTGEGNGWVGKGWSFSFGAVTRDTREGIPLTLGYPPAGRYMLNGSPLIREGTTNRYRTEHESHQHITFDPNANNGKGEWIVKDPDGTTARYSEWVKAFSHSNGDLGVREWLLGQVVDTKGNTITYKYKPHSWTVRYPEQIYWGNLAAGSMFHALKFGVVGPRDDVRTSFAEGSKVIEDQLLDTIEVFFGTNSDGSGDTLVRTYELFYPPDPDSITKATRLSSVQESGPGGAVSGPTRTTSFTYTNGTVDLEDPNDAFLNGLNGGATDGAYLQTRWSRHFIEGPQGESYHLRGEYKGNTMVADLDNDGIPEFIRGAGGDEGTDLTEGSKVWAYRYGQSQTWADNTPFWVPTAFRKVLDVQCCGEPMETRDLGARFLDLNRDGDQDLVISYAEGNMSEQKAWRNDNPKGAAWTPIAFSLPVAHGNQEQLYFSDHRQDSGVRIADVNGDGHPDIIHAYGLNFIYPEPPFGYLHARSHVFDDDLGGPNGDECFPVPDYQRPPYGWGVYLKNGSAVQWNHAPSFALPADVRFVGLVPADEDEWGCPDGADVRFTQQGTERQSFDALLDSDLGTQLIDVNGDGLPDIVKATSYRYGPLNTEYTAGPNGVWINTGRGWTEAPDPAWSAAINSSIGVVLHSQDRRCSVNCKVPWTLLDINDDGLPELLKNTDYDDGISNTRYVYYRNTGTGWTTTSKSFPGLFDLSHGQVFEDFSGDGRPDFFASWRSQDILDTVGDQLVTPRWKFRASAGDHPDQLKTVTNWMGGKSEIVYWHSSKWRDQHNGTLPQTRTVVRSVETDADPGAGTRPLRARNPADPNTPGTGARSLVEYTYLEGKFDFTYRVFRGFGLVKTTANPEFPANRVYAETTYHQDPDNAGLVARVVTKDSDENVVQTKQFEYETPQTIPGVWDRQLTKEIERDETGAIVREVETTYDAYANPLCRTETLVPATGNDWRRTCWTYAPFNTDEWLLRFPASKSVLKGSGGPPPTNWAVVAETLYGYDQQEPGPAPQAGLLTKTDARNFHGSEGPRVITKATHDALGNKTSETNANGKVTLFTYDAGDTFLTAITNPLGHAVSFFYHGVNAPADDRSSAIIPGALQKFVDPNGAETFYSYDNLGRLTELWESPDGQSEQVLYTYFDFGNPGQQRVKVETRTQASPEDHFLSVHWLDGFGRIVQTRSELPDPTPGVPPDWGMVVTRQYDLLGRLWRTSLPRQLAASNTSYLGPVGPGTHWSSTKHDALGRPEEETSFDRTTRYFDYSGLRVTATNQNGVAKHLDHDSYGRLWRVTELDGNTPLGTTYEYDVLDGLRKIISLDDPNHPTVYEYDSLGRRRKMDHPDRGQWEYTYDGLGNLVEQKDAKQKLIRFDYDELGRLTQKHTTDPNTPHKLLGKFYYDNQQPVDGDKLDALFQEVAFYDWGGTVGALPAWTRTLNGSPYVNQGFTPDAASSSLRYQCPPPPAVCENYGAWLDHLVDVAPSPPMAPLALSVTFQDHPNSHFYVEFRDQYNIVIAQGANLASGTGQRVTRRVSVPVDRYPQIGVISLKRYYGDIQLFHSSLEKTSGGAPDVFDPNAPGNYVAQNGNGLMAPVAGSPRTYKVDTKPYPPLETERSYRPDGVQHIVPDSVDEPLTLNVRLVDTPGSEVYVDLYNASDGNVARVSGNLTPKGSGQVVTRQVPVELQLQQHSTVTRVYVHATVGRLELLESFLARGTGKPVYYNAPETPSSSSFTVKNGIGRMTAFLDDTGQSIFSYDLRGNLLKERKAVDGLGYLTQHAYGYDNLPVAMTYPNGEVVTTRYDAARRMVGLDSNDPDPGTGQPLNLVRSVDYNLYGQIDKIVYGHSSSDPNGPYNTKYAYHEPGVDPQGDLRLKSAVTRDKLAGDVEMQNLAYTYDAVGNVKTVVDASGAAGTAGQATGTYDYDTLDRLTEAIIGVGGDQRTYLYGFDALGNPIQMDDQEQEFGLDCGAAWGPHQLCETLGQNYHYDANGNLLRIATGSTNHKVLSYDVENRLKSATQSFLTLHVDYDAQGTRVKRSLGGLGDPLTTYYPGPHYEKRPEDEDGTTSLYHAFGRLIAERTRVLEGGEGLRFFFADHLGSSSLVKNTSNNSVAWTQVYRPFGSDFTATEPTKSRYKFTGQEQDFEWLYNFRARSYLPGVGVFAQPDPIDWTPERLQDPQQLNPYAYARGNPLKYTDPTGEVVVAAPLLVPIVAELAKAAALAAVATAAVVMTAVTAQTGYEVLTQEGGQAASLEKPVKMTAELEATLLAIGSLGAYGTPAIPQTMARDSTESGSESSEDKKPAFGPGAKSKEQFEKHKKGIEDARAKVKDLQNQIKDTKGPKVQKPIKEQIDRLIKDINGHVKEVKQKWDVDL